MILRSLHSPAVLFLSTALVATSALSQSTHSTPAPTSAQPALPASQGTVVEDMIVRVNDQVITRSDYQRADQQLQAELRRANLNPETDPRMKDLLRDLIDQQLLLSKGKELGITGETELIKQLDEIRKQNHLETMEDLEKAAQSQGVSYEDFKQSQRTIIITQTVVREEVGRHIQLTQADATAYYNTHKAEFEQPESVHLSEILIPSAETDDPAKVAAAQAKANEIYAALKGGASFDKTAKSSSAGPTAQQGGDLGNFRRGQLANALEDKTFAMDAGQFTEPVRTKQGFVILKVDAHPRGGVPDMKDVEQQVEEGAFMERMQPALRQYLTKLREEAYIDIKPGFIDTGASPNQTKPVYSAYTPPAPKKKKKTTAQARYRSTSHGASTPAAAAAGASAGAAAASTGATTQSAAAATDAASGATASSSTAATTTTQAAAKAPASMKPGKKEKIRYGQAPRETLPAAAGETEHVDAGAGPPTAAPEVANAQEPVNPLEPKAAPVPEKTRYSDRAKVAKPKTAKGPKVDPFAPAPATAEETATQKTQAAPLGLGGDTSKKPPKPKNTSGEKVRYSDVGKTPPPAPAPAPSANPSPAAVPMEKPLPPADAAPQSAVPPAGTAAPSVAPAPQQ
jgi:peptidyl-prolyl cis-trans isomerase SurA